MPRTVLASFDPSSSQPVWELIALPNQEGLFICHIFLDELLDMLCPATGCQAFLAIDKRAILYT